ncbi:MAG: hypothetical protein QNJ40_11180 [Xanthomonadales bacterium]|nr:hypothetical protein [Xanthomonadales bacterium]
MFRFMVLALALAFAGSAYGHSEAPLNKDGCHKGKRHQDYHCHQGELKDRRFKNEQEARRALIQARIAAKGESSAGQPEGDVDPS